MSDAEFRAWVDRLFEELALLTDDELRELVADQRALVERMARLCAEDRTTEERRAYAAYGRDPERLSVAAEIDRAARRSGAL